MNMLDIQKALNALGYGPLDEDGLNGPATKAAVVAFQKASGLDEDGIAGPNTQNALKSTGGSENRASGDPAPTPAGALKRIIMHWSAGGHTVSQLDRDHYHFIVSGVGEVVAGKYAPEDNISTSGGYAAHTLSCNTGSIGVSMAAMAGASDSPFKAGSQPITEVQLKAFVKMVADLSKKYGIPVTRETVLSHAEVQPTLGIKQRGKWDIAWIPGMSAPGNPVEVGDKIRAMIQAEL